MIVHQALNKTHISIFLEHSSGSMSYAKLAFTSDMIQH